MAEVALTLSTTGNGGSVSLSITTKKKWTTVAIGDGGTVSMVFDRLSPLNSQSEYRLVVADVNGVRYAELDQAVISSMSWVLNGVGNLSFSLPDGDPKLDECQIISREIQVWRNGRVIWCGPIIRASRNDGLVQFQCSDLLWYFTRRVAGKTPKTNLLTNPGFEDDELTGWNLGYNKVSKPAQNPDYQLVFDDPDDEDNYNNTVTGTIYRDGQVVPGRALKLFGSTTYTSNSTKTYSADSIFTATNATTTKSTGRKTLDTYASSVNVNTMTLTVEVHGDDTSTEASTLAQAEAVKARLLVKRPTATITAIGRGATMPVKKNTSATNRKANRRVVIKKATVKPSENLYQYVWQETPVKAFKASKKSTYVSVSGWYKVLDGEWVKNNYKKTYLMITRIKQSTGKVVQTVTQKLDSTRGVWTRIEAGITVPADDVQYLIRVYLLPPVGSIIWDEMSMSVQETLSFTNTDQATIVKELVEYAQDPANGKSDLNIGTNCPLTGKVRNRDLDIPNREVLYDAIMEMPTFIDGCDVSIDLDTGVDGSVTRTLRTHFPLKGGTFDSAVADCPVLVLGSNVATYGTDWDGEDAANAVVIIATEDDNGSADEAAQVDTDAFGSLILEKAYTAIPGASLQGLAAQAARGIRRYSRPSVIPSITTMPEYADELFDRVKTGSVVRVILDDAYLNVDGYYRPTQIDLDPNTDTFTYTLQAEYV